MVLSDYIFGPSNVFLQDVAVSLRAINVRPVIV